MASGSDSCGSHRSSRMTSSLISASVFIGSPVPEVHAALPSVRQAPRSHIPHPGRSTRHAGRGPAHLPGLPPASSAPSERIRLSRRGGITSAADPLPGHPKQEPSLPVTFSPAPVLTTFVKPRNPNQKIPAITPLPPTTLHNPP